jgi:cell division protein FtsQ
VSALQAALARPLDIALNVSPRARRRALAVAAAFLALLALYMIVLRNCPLVKVERVTVTGVTTSDASKLRQALAATGRSMTTLHVDQGRLDKVASSYPVVRELRVSTDFPHGLRIQVVENEPAAVAVAGGSRVPIAADGTILRGLPADPGLAQLQLKGALPPERITEPAALKAARVLGAAPLALRNHLAGLGQDGDKGLTVKMRNGPLLIFGDTTRLRAKWMAATRVLADRSSRGATYIDLRLPDRPAAGGVAAATLQPVAPTDQSTPAATPQAAPAGQAATTTQQTTTPQPQAVTPATPATPAPTINTQP